MQADGAAFPATNPSDVLVELIYALEAGYRQNAPFVMNRKTRARSAASRTTTASFRAMPASAGQAASVMGFPVAEAEDMPDIAAGSCTVAYGDFKRGYLVADRGMRVLRDPYLAKPHILYSTTKRVGGGVQDCAAIKLLKFTA